MKHGRAFITGNLTIYLFVFDSAVYICDGGSDNEVVVGLQTDISITDETLLYIYNG